MSMIAIIMFSMMILMDITIMIMTIMILMTMLVNPCTRHHYFYDYS